MRHEGDLSFIRDDRMLTVAVSRAIQSLIFVGHRSLTAAIQKLNPLPRIPFSRVQREINKLKSVSRRPEPLPSVKSAIDTADEEVFADVIQRALSHLTATATRWNPPTDEMRDPFYEREAVAVAAAAAATAIASDNEQEDDNSEAENAAAAAAAAAPPPKNAKKAAYKKKKKKAQRERKAAAAAAPPPPMPRPAGAAAAEESSEEEYYSEDYYTEDENDYYSDEDDDEEYDSDDSECWDPVECCMPACKQLAYYGDDVCSRHEAAIERFYNAMEEMFNDSSDHIVQLFNASQLGKLDLDFEDECAAFIAFLINIQEGRYRFMTLARKLELDKKWVASLENALTRSIGQVVFKESVPRPLSFLQMGLRSRGLARVERAPVRK